jgi:hypothetical protein
VYRIHAVWLWLSPVLANSQATDATQGCKLCGFFFCQASFLVERSARGGAPLIQQASSSLRRVVPGYHTQRLQARCVKVSSSSLSLCCNVVSFLTILQDYNDPSSVLAGRERKIDGRKRLWAWPVLTCFCPILKRRGNEKE